MSKLLITRDDIRKAVRQYYEDYEPKLFEKYDFDIMQFNYDGKRDNLSDIDYVVEEKKPKDQS